MKKKFVTIVSALLMLIIFLSACGQKEVNGPTPDTSKQETTTEENKTEKETTTEPKCIVIEPTETEIPTQPVSDPTRASTTCVPDVSVNFLYKPEKIIFYHNGKTQTLTEEMNKEVIKEINSYLRQDYKGSGWKYAAEKSMIDEIKNHLHIEIYYDSVQTFSTSNSADERKYNHLLVSLEGQYKNIIFFGKDGKYMSIPIGPLYDDDFSEDILKHIFDE